MTWKFYKNKRKWSFFLLKLQYYSSVFAKVVQKYRNSNIALFVAAGFFKMKRKFDFFNRTVERFSDSKLNPPPQAITDRQKLDALSKKNVRIPRMVRLGIDWCRKYQVNYQNKSWENTPISWMNYCNSLTTRLKMKHYLSHLTEIIYLIWSIEMSKYSKLNLRPVIYHSLWKTLSWLSCLYSH